MVRILKRDFHFLILFICIVLGLIRKNQIDAFEISRFGHVHSTGMHTLLLFASSGIYLAVIAVIMRQLYESRYTLQEKIKASIFAGIASIPVLYVITTIMQ